MNKVWLIGGAMVLSMSGATMAACGSSTNTGGAGTGATGGTASTGTASTTTSSSGNTGGTAATSSSSTTTGTGGTTTGTGGSASSSSGECGKVTTLHPPPDAGLPDIYCPFSGVGDAGNDYCQGPSQICCETAEGSSTPSQCMATSNESSCPMAFAKGGSTVWECEQNSDCATGQICCAVPYANTTDTASIVLGTPAGQCGNFAADMGGTKCTTGTTCANGFQMCSTADNSAATGCATGTCTPFSKSANDVGGCM